MLVEPASFRLHTAWVNGLHNGLFRLAFRRVHLLTIRFLDAFTSVSHIKRLPRFSTKHNWTDTKEEQLFLRMWTFPRIIVVICTILVPYPVLLQPSISKYTITVELLLVSCSWVKHYAWKRSFLIVMLVKMWWRKSPHVRQLHRMAKKK